MNKRHFLVIVFLMILVLPCSNALSKQLIIDSGAQFQFALKAMEKGDYERAIGELERFIYFFPEDEKVLDARVLIGTCHLEQRAYEKARKTLHEVWKTDPKDPRAGKALLLIGESYYRQGVWKEAEYTFKRVLKNYPEPGLKSRALYRLGWTQLQADKWHEASEAFGRIEKKSPLSAISLDLSDESLKGEELPQKDPVMAGVLSGVLPGLGHAYSNRYKDGIVAFLLNGLFIWAAVESFDQDHDVLGGILTFIEAGWYSGTIYGAVNAAHKKNRKVREDFRRNLSKQFKVGLMSTKEGHLGLALKIAF